MGVSGVGVATSAELTSLPTDSARAIRVIVARLPGAIDSSLHLIGLRLEQAPLALSTARTSAGAEKTSVMVGVSAVAGPWLVIVIVYFSLVPKGAWVWSTVFVMSRSASLAGTATGLTIALELSSSGCAIGSFADAVAVFCTVVPAAEGATLALSVTRAVPPAARVPAQARGRPGRGEQDDSRQPVARSARRRGSVPGAELLLLSPRRIRSTRVTNSNQTLGRSAILQVLDPYAAAPDASAAALLQIRMGVAVASAAPTCFTSSSRLGSFLRRMRRLGRVLCRSVDG